MVTREPSILYKYLSWKPGHVRESLRDHAIYFTPPRQLNDPQDCMVAVRWDLLDDEKSIQLWKELEAQLERIDNDAANEVRTSGYSPHIIRDYLMKTHRFAPEFRDERLGIFSLASYCNDFAMWSNYGDCHKGFCIGYSVEVLDRILGINLNSDRSVIRWQVDYVDTVRELDPRTGRLEYILLQQFTTKHVKWAHEDEIRYVSLGCDNGRLVKIPPDAYQEVIFGFGISDEHAEDIKTSLRKSGIRAKLYQTKSEILRCQLKVVAADNRE